MDWQAPKKTTPQKLARVQRATSNPIPECASPSLYIDLRTKTASSVARGSRGNWPWEAEVAFIPVNGAGGGVCAESRPPCVYPTSYPSLAGGHLAMNGRKEGEGRREQGWATPMWPDTGYHLTSSARCPAGPTQSKLAPGTRGGMPLLPHPSGVKAQGGTPASRRAPFSPMLSAAVPRSLSGVPPFSASSAFLCSKVGVVAGSVWHPVFLCCPCLPPEASLGKEQVVPVDT